MTNIISGKSCINIYSSNMSNLLVLFFCVYIDVDAVTIVDFCTFTDEHFGESLPDYVDCPLV